MKNLSDNLAFQLLRNTLIAVFAVLFIGIAVVAIKYLPETLESATGERCKGVIMSLARKGEAFTLAQASNAVWDEARLITYQYDTGFGTNENDDYYCKVDCTNNPEYNILVFFKDKKYVFDFSFNTFKDFTFADNLETISADTVFVPVRADTAKGYILNTK